MRIIGYERVSTARQGASGLGIAAQRQAIDGFVAQRGATLIARFTEVESGRNPDRPELGKRAASRQGHRGDAGDRQARPAVAQRRLPADAARQRRAVRRGRPAGGQRPDRRDHGAGGAAGARGDLEADQGGAGGRQGAAGCSSATRMAPRRCGGPAKAARRFGRPSRGTPTGMRGTSRRSSRTSAAAARPACRAIADELNARGMLTRRGGRWHVSTVMNLLDRLGLREAACASPG